MAKYKNRHGLDRYIPTDVKREVRQRDGFGCVVCGSSLVEYEHFDPPFKDAKEHKAEGIALLCPQHHSSKGRTLSSDTIRRAMANPRAKQDGFAWEIFDPGLDHPEIVIGGVRGMKVDVFIQIYGERVLWIDPPEAEGAPFRISAMLKSVDGSVLLHIDQNELKFSAKNWDVKIVSNRFLIKNSDDEVVVSLLTDPGVGFVFDKLSVVTHGVIIIAEDGDLYVEAPGKWQYVLRDCAICNAEYLVLIEGSGVVFGRAGCRAPMEWANFGSVLGHDLTSHSTGN